MDGTDIDDQLNPPPCVTPKQKQDIVDPIADERLADFVVRSHMRSHPLAQGETGTEDMQQGACVPAAGSSLIASLLLITAIYIYLPHRQTPPAPRRRARGPGAWQEMAPSRSGC
jgi:hypothetical protein